MLSMSELANAMRLSAGMTPRSSTLRLYGRALQFGGPRTVAPGRRKLETYPGQDMRLLQRPDLSYNDIHDFEIGPLNGQQQQSVLGKSGGRSSDGGGSGIRNGNADQAAQRGSRVP